MCAFRPTPSVILKARPPFHFPHGVLHQATMGIVCEPRENLIFTYCHVALDLIKTNVAGVDKTRLVSLLDIVDQFRRAKVGAAGNEFILSRPGHR